MERDPSILRRTIGNLEFANPLIFGGGTCKTIEDVRAACRTNVGGTEIGTITNDGGAGNLPSTNNFYAEWRNSVLMYTLNSLGMPNPGIEYWTTYAQEAIHLAHSSDKKIGMNVIGKTIEQTVFLVVRVLALGFDWVTLNGGCPNKYDENGKPLEILSFSLEDVAKLIAELREIRRPAHAAIWWKPSPNTNTVSAVPQMAKLIGDSEVFTGYIANNTVPHCFAFDAGKQAISAGDGRAGMGGPAVKPLAMGHLKTIDSILPSHFARLGSGGVTFGEDIIDYLRIGASLVHMTSRVWAPSPASKGMDYRVADEVLLELLDHPELEEVLSKL